MDPRKRFSDPLATTEKQTVSFLNERQGIVRYQEKNDDVPDGNKSALDGPRVIIERVDTDLGEDVPDGALSSLLYLSPMQSPEIANEKKEPKKSNLKRDNSRAAKNNKGIEGVVSFETEREVKFEAEPHLNNTKTVQNYQSKELEFHHNILEGSDDEFYFKRK